MKTPLPQDLPMKIGWVNANKVEEFLGLSKEELYKQKYKGSLVRRTHWVIDPLGKVMWHLDNIKQLVKA